MILPGEDPGLARHLARRTRAGYDQNVNPLGEAVLGEDEAHRRLDTVLSTIRRADVDYVSVKITAIYSQVDPLAFGPTVDVLSDRLRTLYRAGRAADPPTFVNLDMEAYDDLHLTVAAFRRVLDEEEFAALDAGIVVQAYIPDSTAVLADLCAWARERHARSGGSIKVRVVKGANLAMERVEAELRGWPQAPSTEKAEVDARYKHLLDLALDPDLDGAVRVGVASHNLFDVAWAVVLAEATEATARLDLEMLEGMAPAQAEAVRRRAGRLLLYAPVVAHDDFEAAIAYLVRRLDENAAPENFLHDLFALDVGSPEWERQRARFEAAVAGRHALDDRPRRDQDRSVPVPPGDPDAPFVNEPDTDFTGAANRTWVAEHLASDRRPMDGDSRREPPGRPGCGRSDSGGRGRGRQALGGPARIRATPCPAPDRRRPGRTPGRGHRRHGERDGQDDGRGRRRSVRGRRLRPLVRRLRQAAVRFRERRAGVRTAPGHRRRLTLELPPGHPGRWRAGRPRRPLGRHPQAGAAGRGAWAASWPTASRRRAYPTASSPSSRAQRTRWAVV